MLGSVVTSAASAGATPISHSCESESEKRKSPPSRRPLYSTATVRLASVPAANRTEYAFESSVPRVAAGSRAESPTTRPSHATSAAIMQNSHAAATHA